MSIVGPTSISSAKPAGGMHNNVVMHIAAHGALATAMNQDQHVTVSFLAHFEFMA
jgi:hypothetical protein